MQMGNQSMNIEWISVFYQVNQPHFEHKFGDSGYDVDKFLNMIEVVWVYFLWFLPIIY